MAAPNSYNFTVTRDQLITDALLHINAIGEGETPSTNAVTEAARLLNMMLKLRAADGMPLWSIKRGYVLPFTGASSINTNSHVTTSYIHTTISADEAVGQTQLSVTDSTGMSISDQVGVECDDSTILWTTITAVDSSVLITIATPLVAAAGSGNTVFAYTASSGRVQRPLRITDANMLNVTSNSSWEITVDERRDYFNLGSRTSLGVPNRIYYDPQLGSNVADPTTSSAWYGTIYVYPRFNNGDYVIEFTYQEPMQDLDASSDNPYWPQEFYLPLMLELSSLIGPKYGVSLEERKVLVAEAKMYRDEALATIQSEGSVFLQPESQ